MQKTQEYPGFFWVVSFLIYPSGRVDQKKIPTFSSAFGSISPVRQEQYHLRGQDHITHIAVTT